MPVADGIRDHRDLICQTLHVGYANWDALVGLIDAQERSPRVDFADEQVWTFLVACGYAMAGPHGTNELGRLLTGDRQDRETKAWFEVLPEPPRLREGSTHLDLAFGSIALRNGTRSGIELRRDERSWISFVECKWYSDIASSVSYDQHRNQLARVIENAIYFGQGDRFADEVHVTLVTPDIFQSCRSKSRLYRYKFSEYNVDDKTDLVTDLEASCLQHRRAFPQHLERLPNLQLHWVTYETLFKRLPDSELRPLILDFATQFNGTAR